MFCNNCGKQLPDNTKFCPACGTRVAAEQAEPSVEQPQPAAQPYVQPAQPVSQPYEQPNYTNPQAQQAYMQGQYQQPQPYGYAQPGYAAPQYGASAQPKKKSKALLFVILGLVLVAGIAVACIFIFGGGGGGQLTATELSGSWTGTVEYTKVGGLFKDLYSEFADITAPLQTEFVFAMNADGKTGTAEWFISGASQCVLDATLSGGKVVVQGTYNAMEFKLTLKPGKQGAESTLTGSGSFGDPSVISVDFKISLTKTGGISPSPTGPVSTDLAAVLLGEWTTEPDYESGSYLIAIRESGACGYGYAYPANGQQISDYDQWDFSYWDWNDYVLAGNALTTTDRYGDTYTYTVEVVGVDEMHLSLNGETLVFYRVKDFAEMTFENYLSGEWASINAVYEDGSYSYLNIGGANVSVGSVAAATSNPDHGDWYGDDWGYADVYGDGTYILVGPKFTISLNDGKTYVFSVQILDAYTVRLTDTATNTYTDYCKLS